MKLKQLAILGFLLGIIIGLLVLPYVWSFNALRLAKLNQELLGEMVETDTGLVETDTMIIEVLQDLKGKQ